MTARPVMTRRRFLAGVSLAALCSAGAAPQLALGQQANGVDAFLALSRAVTGHDALDVVFAEAILGAFVSFGAEREIAAIALEADSPARRALLKAWYLGRVAPGGIADAETADLERAQGEAGSEDRTDDTVVGFEATLMGRVVADILPLRSYCGGRPHFWTEPPEVHANWEDAP